MTTFNVTLRTREGDDSIRTLRAALKLIATYAVQLENIFGPKAN
jgi:hypothetical protein